MNTATIITLWASVAVGLTAICEPVGIAVGVSLAVWLNVRFG